MTRTEHMNWAKNRANAILSSGGKPFEAMTSMVSDLGKHPETARHQQIAAMMSMSMEKTESGAREFINGFA